MPGRFHCGLHDPNGALPCERSMHIEGLNDARERRSETRRGQQQSARFWSGGRPCTDGQPNPGGLWNWSWWKALTLWATTGGELERQGLSGKLQQQLRGLVARSAAQLVLHRHWIALVAQQPRDGTMIGF